MGAAYQCPSSFRCDRSSSKTGQAKEESRLGCRYSVLLELPSFQPIEMLLIDPMHNLFLGTAKEGLVEIYQMQMHLLELMLD